MTKPNLLGRDRDVAGKRAAEGRDGIGPLDVKDDGISSGGATG